MDTTGDEGTHYLTYCLLPHEEGFSPKAVVQPAYRLNYRPVCRFGSLNAKPFASVSSEDIIIETIKQGLDGKGIMLRLYDCSGGTADTKVNFSKPYDIYECNLLEDITGILGKGASDIDLYFRPFQIRTIKLEISKYK